MRQALLVSVAAAALAAGSTLALSQGGNPGGGAQGGATINANPGGASGGAAGSLTKEAPGTVHETPAPGGKKGAQERPPQNQKTTQDRQNKEPATQQAPAQQGGGKQGQTEQPSGSKQGQATQPSGSGSKQGQTTQPSGSKQGQSTQQPSGGAKQGAAERPMTSSNVSLTTEQKTTIRNTVINTGPKVTSVNFDVKVGVVVPRTVRVAPLPVTLIEIQPAWRGFMYFVYADEVIIVEPGTLRIVAVLQV